MPIKKEEGKDIYTKGPVKVQREPVSFLIAGPFRGLAAFLKFRTLGTFKLGPNLKGS